MDSGWILPYTCVQIHLRGIFMWFQMLQETCNDTNMPFFFFKESYLAKWVAVVSIYHYVLTNDTKCGLK